jgi:hypothetical protein
MTFGIEARSSHLWEAQTIVVSDTWDKSQTESLPYFQDLSYPQNRTVRRVASYELL